MSASHLNRTFEPAVFSALIGWLLGSRGGEQGKAVAESLRTQLDGVARERDEARDQIGPLSAELARLVAENPSQFSVAAG